MDRRFLGILAAIAIIFIGVFALTQKSSNSSGGNNNNSSGSSVSHNVEGQGAKGVTLVEWGDYECPICEAYYLPLKQAVTQNLTDIYFQFKNLPLTQIHQNAFAGARAAEAAGMQGKYWQMHDKLYDNQNGWVSSTDPLSIFSTYAQQIGLNVNQFKTDYASGKVNGTINADLAAFDKTGKEHATPTFFLDGRFIDNSQLSDPQTGQPSADKIAAVIKAEIDKKGGTSAAPNSSATQAAQPAPASSGNPY
jgi:protein-disulfide isomerase